MAEPIKGVLAPVVTPFDADLRPDPERLVDHCQWLISQNCGLVPFGTTSEANSMAASERMMLLDALIAAGLDSARIMPGTGCCSIAETVSLTTHGVKHGCAGVLMLPPFYYKDVNEEGLYRYFSEVIQRVGDARLRVYLYHIPPVAIVGITPKLVERLLNDYPGTIAGMKDSSGDWNHTKMFLDRFSEQEFGVFVGTESFLLDNMRCGGVGTISATANVNPAAIFKLYDRFRRRSSSGRCLPAGGSMISRSSESVPDDMIVSNAEDQQALGASASATEHELEQLQRELDMVRQVFRQFPSLIAALKHAIAVFRKDPDWTRVRPPLVRLSSEQGDALVAELARVGFSRQLIVG